MARVLVIPDSHLNLNVIANGIKLADKIHADKIVMLGDYVDSWTSFPYMYHQMINYIKWLCKSRFSQIVPLLGNHEVSYFVSNHASGWRKDVSQFVRDSLENDYRFQLAAEIDGVLYSHAGVTNSWIEDSKIIRNEDKRKAQYNVTLGRYNAVYYTAEVIARNINMAPSWLTVYSIGPDRGGDSVAGPLWADMKELLSDPLRRTVQIVGHTPVTKVENFGLCWFADVFSNGNRGHEYIVVEEGEVDVLDINKYLEPGERGFDWDDQQLQQIIK